MSYSSVRAEDCPLGGADPANQVSVGYVLTRLLGLLAVGIAFVAFCWKLEKALDAQRHVGWLLISLNTQSDCGIGTPAAMAP